jgi:hypothetical protein
MNVSELIRPSGVSGYDKCREFPKRLIHTDGPMSASDEKVIERI